MNEERDNHRVDVRWLEKFIFGTETTMMVLSWSASLGASRLAHIFILKAGAQYSFSSHR